LRDRAARLRELAIKAREEGKALLSNEIADLAIEASDQADEMDQGSRGGKAGPDG
jgi:hypothetical protein